MSVPDQSPWTASRGPVSGRPWPPARTSPSALTKTRSISLRTWNGSPLVRAEVQLLPRRAIQRITREPPLARRAEIKLELFRPGLREMKLPGVIQGLDLVGDLLQWIFIRRGRRNLIGIRRGRDFDAGRKSFVGNRATAEIAGVMLHSGFFVETLRRSVTRPSQLQLVGRFSCGPAPHHKGMARFHRGDAQSRRNPFITVCPSTIRTRPLDSQQSSCRVSQRSKSARAQSRCSLLHDSAEVIPWCAARHR